MASYHSRIAAIPSAPERVAENHFHLAPQAIFIRYEQSPQRRLNPQRLEKSRSHARPLQTLRIARTAENPHSRHPRPEALTRPAPIAKLEKIPADQSGTPLAGPRRNTVDPNQFPAVWVWKWLEKQTMDQGKNGRGCADADRQNYRRDQRKSRFT